MASPFAKYQSEQVQQIAPGFVEAYGRAGAAIGQGIAGGVSAVAKGMEEAEQKKIEQAKMQGAINPYLRNEVANVQRSIENGFLQVGKDGKVSITPGQEGNLDPNKVGRAIDLYNQTEGGKKELKPADLAGVISTIQSYDTLEKQAAEKAATARAAKLAEVEYQSKLLGNAKTLSEGMLAFAAEKRSLVDGMVASGNIAGANFASAEARALYDKAQSIALDAYRSAGIKIDSYMPPAPVQPPARPAAAAVGSGASTLYTVITPTEFENPITLPESRLLVPPAGIQSSGINVRPSAAPAPAPAPVSQVAAPAAVQTPAPAPAPVRPATPAASPTATQPAAQKTTAPTSRNLLLGTMPTREPEATTTPAAGAQGQAPTTTVTKPAYIQQAETEIASLRTAREIYINQAKTYRNARLGVAGLTSDQLKNYEALAKSAESQALKIDDSITEKMKALTAERTREETGAIATTKLSMEQSKAMDDRFGYFSGGYMAAGRAEAIKLYPGNLFQALSDPEIPGFQGEKKEVTETIGSLRLFMEGTMSIEQALDSRLEKGNGFFDRFTLTSDEYEDIAKGNVGEKILLASMRKIIVSGGNFSDADRGFVLEAIASINTMDPTKSNEYFKALNKVMASMIYKMYDGKLESMGIERHLELLTPEQRKKAVSETETAFKTRFGLEDNGEAAKARAKLSTFISEAKKQPGYASSAKDAERAVASFIDTAKEEAGRRARVEAARVPEAKK